MSWIESFGSLISHYLLELEPITPMIVNQNSSLNDGCCDSFAGPTNFGFDSSRDEEMIEILNKKK